MARKTNYFRLGLFIIVGSLILTAVLVIFGMGALFRSTIPAETYFNESVEGLDVGAPVKYRGVKIGNVEYIGFIVDEYPQLKGDIDTRYVLVKMKLYTQLDKTVDIDELDDYLEREIKKGLRIRLTTQGLTGVAFLEINYFDPKLNKILPISWKPNSFYIPSAPSTMSRIENAIDTISKTLNQVEKINIVEIVHSLNSFISDLNKSLQGANVSDIGELVVQNLTELRDALSQMNDIIGDPKAKTILPNASDAMAGVKNVIGSSQDDIIQTTRGLRKFTEDLNAVGERVMTILNDPQLASAMEKLPETMQNIQGAAAELNSGAARLNRLVRNLNDLSLSQRGAIEAILENTKSLMQNLDELSGDAKRNPSRVFFGRPPEAINPEEQGAKKDIWSE